MRAIACQILTILGVGAAPAGAPIAGIARIGIVIPVRVVTFDVSEIEDHLIIATSIIQDDVVVADQRCIGAMRVTGHEDETHRRIGLFKSIHGIQVELHRLFAVAGLLPAP